MQYLKSHHIGHSVFVACEFTGILPKPTIKSYNIMNASIKLLKMKVELTLKKDEPKIEESEVLEILGNEFPEINSELEKIPNAVNVYTSIKCFADFTRKLVSKGNLKEVKHCFTIAEKMLCQGNHTVKNAIENVYIFSLSSVLGFASPFNLKIKGIMNGALRREYNRQVCTSGI